MMPVLRSLPTLPRKPLRRGMGGAPPLGGGGVGDSGTHKPPVPMPSALYPSHGVRRFGTGVRELPPLRSIPADAAAQEGGAERDEVRALLVVLAVAVAAGRRLVEVCLRVAHRLQLGRHLAGVPRMHPVILAR